MTITFFLIFLSRATLPGGYTSIPGNLLFEAGKIEFYTRIYNQPFSEELLKECLYYERISHPDVVLRQARLETGNYASQLFKVANNLFGMKTPYLRKNASLGEYNNFALFFHWTDSVKDYFLWQQYYLNLGYNFDNYYCFLQFIGYAEDPLYIKKIS